MEAITRDVRAVFSNLARRFAGEPEPTELATFRVIDLWHEMTPLERGIEFDTRHDLYSVVRFKGERPDGVNEGEAVMMTQAEANHFSGLGVVEVVCAEAGAYQPDA